MISESPRQKIGGIVFTAVTSGAAAEAILALAATKSATHVHLANAYTIALADKDQIYRDVLRGGIVFADGKPITWFSAIFKQTPRLRQVRGPQLFLDVLDRGRAMHLRHFFLGGSDAALSLLRENIEGRFPGVSIAGTHSPAFRPLTNDELADQDEVIRKSGAQIVWVGLGTPKQDFEARRLAASVRLPTVSVGAAFDFAAGTVKVAPGWMQKAGLEWLFRFISEPRRLWRRYLFGNVRFIWAALRRKSES